MVYKNHKRLKSLRFNRRSWQMKGFIRNDRRILKRDFPLMTQKKDCLKISDFKGNGVLIVLTSFA